MAKKKPVKVKSRKPANKTAPKAVRAKAKPAKAKAKVLTANAKSVKARGKAKAVKAKAPRETAADRTEPSHEITSVDFAPHAEPPPPPPPRPTGPAVVHWEVQARDPAGQRQFFADLFGWEVDANNPQEYGMVQAAGMGIGGGIGATLDTPRTTFYVQVDDIASTLAKAEAMGAQTVLPRTDIGMIVMGQFRDREGNLIGLVEPWDQEPLA